MLREPDVDVETVRRWLHLAVGCLLLTALAFAQRPGRMVGDTKLDLIVDPGGFLSRALTMWEPQGGLGQVQNQAYGYLFPMGPFFWAGERLGLDAWIVQRLWWALLWSVAFVGMALLCRALKVGTPCLSLLAGVLYALSPRVLTIMGVNSVEAWPASLAPWVLLPLVVGLRHGPPRLRAAQSALAVGCVGGVNAVATAAVLPLATLWLVMAPRGERRRAMLRWWPPLVLATTAWWWVPLVLLGRYSPPFLDHIESSATTTVSASVLDALRGTTNWVPRATVTYDAGRDLLTWPALSVALAVVAAAGLAGLSLASTPHRRFLVTGLLAGVVLTTLGHTAGLSGWGAPGWQELLDGPLAPMRNLHKFDPVVRIPLVVGATHLLAVLARRIAQCEPDVARWWRRTMAVAVGSCVLAAVAPTWTGRIAGGHTFAEIPSYWSEAADWLAEHPDDTTLVAPSSAFGDYLWGSTGDDVAQPLAGAPWVARPAVPMAPEGTVRLLDAVYERMESGTAAPGLATTLARAGVDRVLLRFDLASDQAGERAELAWQTLRATPGLRLARTFGPTVGGPAQIDDTLSRRFAAGGWQTEHPVIAVFEVETESPPSATPAGELPVVVGAADALVGLDALGVVGPGPVVTAADAEAVGGAVGGPWVLTDSLRRREVDFSRVERHRSGSLGADEPYQADRAAHDFVRDVDEPWVAERRLLGARSLTASSSRAWAGMWGALSPSAAPWSAFDGQPGTAWRAVGGTGWVELDLGGFREVGELTVRGGLAPGDVQRVVVDTAAGPVERTLVGDEPVTVPVGEVDRLRIEVERDFGDAQLAEVASPDLALARPLELPWVRRADQIVLGLDVGLRPSCLSVGLVDRCRPGAGEDGEDAAEVDRIVSLGEGGRYEARLTTTAVAGDPLDELVQRGLPTQVRASSTVSADPRATASRMIDGDDATGWIAAAADAEPTLTVRFDEPRRIDTLRLTTEDSLPASSVDRIVVVDDAGRRSTVDVADGLALVPETVTTSLTLELVSATDAVDVRPDGSAFHLPVGVSELAVGGVEVGLAPPSDEPTLWECGTGPALRVGDTVVASALSAASRQLLDGSVVEALPCGGPVVEVAAGRNRIVVGSSTVARAGRLVLERTEPRPTTDAGPVVATTGHNENPGWVGELDGEAVPAVVVDGWRQAWVVPQGRVDDLVTDFRPGHAYRWALGVGGLLALGLFRLVLGRSLMWAWRRRDAAVGARGPSRWASAAAVAL
ncbi:MAG: alpha-(1-_3)-arabinofuranosyltransferase family protein, partial [Aeromicrobium sp.]|uniref:alpha-(1->3)-arabinofuranosyltransferase domain-containing protein n=1 Tax=Aeromicrobium sp. TaxID=1871063 RepID=UPI0039E465C7